VQTAPKPRSNFNSLRDSEGGCRSHRPTNEISSHPRRPQRNEATTSSAPSCNRARAGPVASTGTPMPQQRRRQETSFGAGAAGTMLQRLARERASCAELPDTRGGEVTVDRDTVASNCSTGNCPSTSEKRSILEKLGSRNLSSMRASKPYDPPPSVLGPRPTRRPRVSGPPLGTRPGLALYIYTYVYIYIYIHDIYIYIYVYTLYIYIYTYTYSPAKPLRDPKPSTPDRHRPLAASRPVQRPRLHQAWGLIPDPGPTSPPSRKPCSSIACCAKGSSVESSLYSCEVLPFCMKCRLNNQTFLTS